MEEKTQGYKDLIVWKIAMELVPQVYRVSRKFPADELYGITSQLRRAMVSVPSNIGEGQGRRHPKEFANFLSIARGSLAEVDTLLNVAYQLDYLGKEALGKLENQIIHVRRLLQKLMQSQIISSTPGSRLPIPD